MLSPRWTILKVLREGSGRKSPVFAYSKLLNVANGHDVF